MPEIKYNHFRDSAKSDRGEQRIKEKYVPIISTIETDDGLEYLAEFKEFLFCGGSGKTEEEAIEDAYKNLEIYLEELTAPESCIVQHRRW